MTRTALVVEDQPPLRQLLRIVVAGLGFEVKLAPDGQTGLELLAVGPHLLITDLRLPRVHGMELTRVARAMSPAPPVLVISGSVAAQEATTIEALGARLLLKPFGAKEVSAAVEELLAGQPR